MIPASSNPHICLPSPMSTECSVLRYESVASSKAVLRSAIEGSEEDCEAERVLRVWPAVRRS